MSRLNFRGDGPVITLYSDAPQSSTEQVVKLDIESNFLYKKLYDDGYNPCLATRDKVPKEISPDFNGVYFNWDDYRFRIVKPVDVGTAHFNRTPIIIYWNKPYLSPKHLDTACLYFLKYFRDFDGDLPDKDFRMTRYVSFRLLPRRIMKPFFSSTETFYEEEKQIPGTNFYKIWEEKGGENQDKVNMLINEIKKSLLETQEEPEPMVS